jgi:hypothetical protein
MSDGREERKEQEERRKWAEREHRDGRFDREEIRDREWPKEYEPERRDSRAAAL